MTMKNSGITELPPPSVEVQRRLELIRNEVRQELSALRYQIECVARDLQWLERRITSAKRG
jgi:hypothetical protein